MKRLASLSLVFALTTASYSFADAPKMERILSYLPPGIKATSISGVLPTPPLIAPQLRNPAPTAKQLGALKQQAEIVFKQVAANPRQAYGAWFPQDTQQHQWCCIYVYRVKPMDTTYAAQLVVWNYRTPNQLNYYNAKGKFWCATPIFVYDETKRDESGVVIQAAGKNIWQVYGGRHRKKHTLVLDTQELQEFKLADAPPIPGSTDKTPMLDPPLLPEMIEASRREIHLEAMPKLARADASIQARVRGNP